MKRSARFSLQKFKFLWVLACFIISLFCRTASVFTKNFTDTALYVAWTGAFRVHGCASCCKRWYFTFNSAECSAPLPIDGVVHLGVSGKTQDPHRVRHIEGHCSNIHKGRYAWDSGLVIAPILETPTPTRIEIQCPESSLKKSLKLRLRSRHKPFPA